MKNKSVYWLSQYHTKIHEDRATALKSKGFNIEFFQKIDTLLSYYTKKRVNILILEDDFPKKIIKTYLNRLAQDPNLYGVRLILSHSNQDNDLLEIAYQSGFRDMIPSDLSHKDWAQRFAFSTSGASKPFNIPNPMVTMSQISGVFAPGRMIWISPSQIRFEAKIKATPGTKLSLTGPLADYLGVKTIPIEIIREEKTNLKYHYSEAYIANWTPPAEKAGKMKIVFDHLEGQGEEQTLKVFAAVKNSDVRNKLFETLNNSKIALATALSKQHIINEPRYFSPHIVLIEDKLCSAQDLNIFSKMAENLPEHAPIVVIGERCNINELKSLAPGRKIFILPKIRENLSQLIFQKFLSNRRWQTSARDQNALSVASNSNFSTCEIYIPARLKQLGPHGVVLNLSTFVGQFGFCRVDSPFIKKVQRGKIFLKIIKSYDHPGNPTTYGQTIECLHTNIIGEKRRVLGNSLFSHLHKQYDLALNKNLFKITSASAIQQKKDEDQSSGFDTVDVVDKTIDHVKDFVVVAKKSPIVEIGVPMAFLVGFLIAGGIALFWLIDEHGPKNTKTGQSFSKQLQIFKERN